jgi:predicted nucleotidyltransferase
MAAFNNPNLAILELVAQALGPVCDRVIFVGGCATGLLLTQERPDRIRITEDVDIVAQALTVHDYHAIEDQVRAQGFSNDMRPDAPICRWVYKSVTLDLMPTVKDILGFANRWYPLALQTAQPVVLPGGVTIKLIAAPVFIGTKLEAFKDRGKDDNGRPDYLGSHDLEDIITVADRRPELLNECRAAAPELRAYLAAEFTALFSDPEFEQALSGHLPGDAFSQQRAKHLAKTLRELSQLRP